MREMIRKMDMAILNAKCKLLEKKEANDQLIVMFIIIAVAAGHENDEGIVALVDALKSDAIKTYIEETYDGAVVPFN